MYGKIQLVQSRPMTTFSHTLYFTGVRRIVYHMPLELEEHHSGNNQDYAHNLVNGYDIFKEPVSDEQAQKTRNTRREKPNDDKIRGLGVIIEEQILVNQDKRNCPKKRLQEADAKPIDCRNLNDSRYNNEGYIEKHKANAKLLSHFFYNKPYDSNDKKQQSASTKYGAGQCLQWTRNLYGGHPIDIRKNEQQQNKDCAQYQPLL